MNQHRGYAISKQYLYFCCARLKKRVKVMTPRSLKTPLLAFLILAGENKCHFWAPETKLDNEALLFKENFEF